MKKKVLEKKSFIPEKDWSETKMILEDEGQEDQGNLALAIQRWASWEVSLDSLPFLPAPCHTLYLTLPLSHRYSVGYT